MPWPYLYTHSSVQSMEKEGNIKHHNYFLFLFVISKYITIIIIIYINIIFKYKINIAYIGAYKRKY